MAGSLDEAAVRHVAHLARLKISDAEVALFAEQLSSVLEFFEQLNELDTKNVQPMAHPLPVRNVFRKDEIRPCCPPEQALGNAPQTQDGFFQVPKVLDQDSA